MSRVRRLEECREKLLDKLTSLGRLSDGEDEATVLHRQLDEVNLALQLAEDGGYGMCIDCDKPIPLARMTAKPEAIRCVKCQERLEQRAGRRYAFS